ncbi:MAG: nucleoside phosphorylase [Halobacteriales archaeon]
MGKQPHLLVEAGDVADVALLPGDPGRVDRIAAACDDHVVVSANREYAVVNATTAGRPITVCSTGIGAPSAAIAVEELAAVGVGTFVRIGTCGALQADVDVGDHVVATAAAKDEGTTKRYEAETVPAAADFAVTAALAAAADAGGHPTHVGPIATDDAFYAETEAYVEAWSAANLLAVEMEAAAVFTLARRHGGRAGAICTVDGNLVRGTQKGETTGDEELPGAADAAIDAAIDVALEAVRSL